MKAMTALKYATHLCKIQITKTRIPYKINPVIKLTNVAVPSWF